MSSRFTCRNLDARVGAPAPKVLARRMPRNLLKKRRLQKQYFAIVTKWHQFALAHTLTSENTYHDLPSRFRRRVATHDDSLYIL